MSLYLIHVVFFRNMYILQCPPKGENVISGAHILVIYKFEQKQQNIVFLK
jgi:hypothetical protein